MKVELLHLLDEDCQRLIWSYYICGLRIRLFLSHLCRTGYNPSSLTESHNILKSFDHTSEIKTLFDGWKYVNVRNMVKGNFSRNVLPPFVQPSLRYLGLFSKNNFHVFAREHLPVQGEPLMIQYDWYHIPTGKKNCACQSYYREDLFSEWQLSS